MAYQILYHCNKDGKNKTDSNKVRKGMGRNMELAQPQWGHSDVPLVDLSVCKDIHTCLVRTESAMRLAQPQWHATSRKPKLFPPSRRLGISRAFSCAWPG